MRTVLGVLLASFALCLSGCGGGDSLLGNALPTEAVKTESRGFFKALENEDLEGAMSYYSDSFQNPDGTTKSDVRNFWSNLLTNATLDALMIDDEKLAPTGTDRVLQTLKLSGVATLRQGDRQGPFASDSNLLWAKEGKNWKIVQGVFTLDFRQ